MAGAAAKISKRFATTIHKYLHEHAKAFLSSASTSEIWGESLMVKAEDKIVAYKGGLGEDGGSEKESRWMEDSFLRLGEGGKQKDEEFIKLRPAEVKIEKTVRLVREGERGTMMEVTVMVLAYLAVEHYSLIVLAVARDVVQPARSTLVVAAYDDILAFNCDGKED
jgi:hypothetical protein